MQDKKTKLWLSVFVLTLAVTGITASLFSTKQKLYKGAVTQASVLTSEKSTEQNVEEKTVEVKFSNESSDRLEQVLKKTTVEKEKNAADQSTFSQSTLFNEPKMIFIADPQTQQEESAESTPPEKVARQEEPQTPATTCESEGLYTYTGRDRPGILYGMCIQCTTDVFLETGGKCI